MAEVDEKKAMVCHYEVMQLEKSSKADEIKKQYKVLALRFHPDRNHGNEEEATLKFKQLAAAYAVLSDPHERKWYDDHREAILRGGDGTKHGDEDADDSYDVWKFFNSTCYSGHDDDSETGFYTVYRKVFDEIAKRESDKTKSDPTLKYSIATTGFGGSATSHSDVLKFYAEWENFASVLSFAWADMYHTVDAPNRATRRVMESENTKARSTARKEYTNQIRSLARFVKKRDPRMAAYEADVARRKQEAEELKKVLKQEELQARKDKRERVRQEYANNYEAQEAREQERKGAFLLADLDSDEEHRGVVGRQDSEDEVEVQKALRKVTLDDFIQKRDVSSTTASGAAQSGEASAGAGGDGEDEEGEESCACEICDKQFKTPAQLTQHNNSKPHRKNAAAYAKTARKDKGAVGKEKPEQP
jgi:DnaJ family protein A protein 5